MQLCLNLIQTNQQQIAMSIYSGFATRSQQECYDQCVESLIYILQRRIIKFYKNQDADQQKFISLVMKIHGQLKAMQNNKYLDPKTSIAINDLVKFMNIHQKNLKPKNRTIEKEDEPNLVPQTLPVVEQKQPLDQTLPKKKQTLWVQKKVTKIEQKMIDQEIQTMGTIYEKKDQNSPKQPSVSKVGLERQAISAFRSKYAEKMSNGKAHKVQEYSRDLMDKIKKRSESHYLPRADISKQNDEGRNHLKQVETFQKKKRKEKYQSRLGIKDIDTQQDIVSEYQVGDIIKEYLVRAKKKKFNIENEREATNNDF